jgi:periplasmic copper chaperone A
MRPVQYVIVIVVMLMIAAWGARNEEPLVPIGVEEVWVRPALAGGNTAIYMSISNNTDKPITLTRITADFAGLVQIHQTVVENDIAHMQQIETGIRIGAGETMQFQPGGYHVMLMNVQQTLNAGDIVPIRLIFDTDQALTIEAEISNSAVPLE